MTASFRSFVGSLPVLNVTVVVDKPAGTADGDILFAAFINNDSSRIPSTPPSGWSLVREVKQVSPTGCAVWLYTKKAGASEPSTYSFTWNYSFNGVAVTAAFQGGSSVSVVGAGTFSEVDGSSPYSIDAEAISVPDDDSLLVFIGFGRWSTSGTDPDFTAPSGFAERVDYGTNYTYEGITIADKTQSSAGSSGAATASVTNATGANGRTLGLLLAIAPATGSSQMEVSGGGEFPVISRVALSQSTVNVPVGNTADIDVNVFDQDDFVLPWLTGQHTSSAPSIATATQLAATTSSGAKLRLAALAAGSATITSTFDDKTAQVTVVAVQTAPMNVIITPASPSVAVLQTIQFAASASEAMTFTWSLSSGSGSINSSTGLYTAPSTPGTAVIRASKNDDATIFAEVTVTIEAAASFSSVSTTWKLPDGTAFANESLDYVCKIGVNTIVQSGTGTTNGSGILTFQIPSMYIGVKVLVQVENAPDDLSTEGRFHGTQVTVAV